MSPQSSHKLAILRCKFSDRDEEPHDDAFYRDLFISRGTEGLNDYYRTVSFGAVDFDSSNLFPWKSIGMTRSDFMATYADRGSKIQRGVDSHAIDRSKYAIVIVIFNDDSGDAGSDGGNGILANAPGFSDMQIPFLAHEIGHKFGLNDSFDESDRLLADDHTFGWYWDQYDIMSARNVFSYHHSRWGVTGPLMCTANQDWNHWIPPERIYNILPGSNEVTEIDLVSLSHTQSRGYVCLKFDGWYFEHRTPDGLDSGLERPCVLIHSITATANATVHAKDAKNYINEWHVGDTFGPPNSSINVFGGVQVEIISFDSKRYTARLRIRAASLGVPRTPSTGGHVFGGVAVDGGGVIILPGGGVIRIPPRSPVLGILGHVGLIAQAEERLIGETKAIVAGQMYREIGKMAERASKQVEELKIDY